MKLYHLNTLQNNTNNNRHYKHKVKRIITAILMLSIFSLGFAQSPNSMIETSEPEQKQIDSLKNLITPYTPVGVKAKIYYDISVKYTNYDSMLKYSLLSLRTEEQMKREDDRIKHEKEKSSLLTYISALSGALIVVSILVFFIFRILKIKKKANDALSEQNGVLISQKAEIMAQRDKIEAQRNEIAIQKNLITEQMHEVEQVNNDLLQSIIYARRIQRAALSSKDEMAENFKDSFVLYRPRNIVSGDYYITEKYGRFSVIITADCTGHGIPGAFLSILGIAAIKEYMRSEEDAETPGVVLDRMRNFIKETLSSTETSKITDGMDMSICSIDNTNMKMHYAIANQKILIVRNGESIILKGDNMPVGRCSYEREHFTSFTEDIQLGDMLYTFSDGLQDQFSETDPTNGRQKKFSNKRLVENLVKIASLPTSEQCKSIESIIDQWRGSTPQTDDMTLIGIRIK